MRSFKLIHTAFKHEAKPIIEFFKLQCIETKPCKLYLGGDIVLIVSGMGSKNTLHVKSVYERYSIEKALNVGIAGCKDRSKEIGSLFTCVQEISGIEFASLSSVDEPLCSDEGLKSTLVDMEAETFVKVSREFLHIDDIYVLKIVSDYLDITIPKKEFVWKIIEKNLRSISEVVTS